ncbi:hypothetical protein AGMMS50268_15160 [Spirochaetia bacterium]|nr:hypothetical protein AGMMS50268_15160 [Spirochaetia bacterium]
MAAEFLDGEIDLDCVFLTEEQREFIVDTQTCLGIIDQMTEAEVFGVSFTGGEPLTRKDFWELTDACLERGIWLQNIYTNGILVDDAFLDKLEERNLKPRFIISFDGVGCQKDGKLRELLGA